MIQELTPQEKKVESDLQRLRPASPKPVLIQRVREQWNADVGEHRPVPGQPKTMQLGQWTPLFKVAAILVLLGAITMALVKRDEPAVVDKSPGTVLPHDRTRSPGASLPDTVRALPIDKKVFVRDGKLYQSHTYEDSKGAPKILILEMPLDTY